MAKRIYYADIHSLKCKNLVITDGVKKIIYEDTIIQKDAEFYRNFLDAYISLDYDNKLFSRDEAMDIIKESKNPEAINGIVFWDENIKSSEVVTKQEFKEIKKQYKLRRNGLK